MLKNLKYEPYFDWVQDYWSSRGEKLDFKKHKYLLQIYQDQHPNIVVMKSAQVGLTERFLTEAIWLPDQFKENSIYFMPTASMVSDLVQERIDDPINNSDYLRLVSGRAKKLIGKQADKVSMKRMSKGFVYFRGSNKPNQIITISGDIIFADELDRMEPESIPYFDKRLEHSSRKWQRWGSTPTVPNFGIHKLFLTSDQHEYRIKCNHCNEQQLLTFWDNVDIERKLLVCKKCRKEIIPWQCDGEWVKTNDSDIRGYHISQLYSPRLDLKKLIEASQKSTEWEIQQFYNQNLGLPYEPKGAKISEEDFQAATRDYTIPFKEPEQSTFMGVDIGKILHVTIMNKKRIVWIGEKKDFEELDGLMREFNVKVAVVDGLPETRKASEFEQRFRGRVFLCYYSGMKEIKEGKWFKKERGKVNTDRTISLDKSTNIVKEQNIEFPKNLDNYPEFKQHCKNLVRIIREEKGNQIAEYVKIGPDHYRHSLNYANLAREIYLQIPVLGVMSM